MIVGLFELTIVIFVAALFAVLAKILKQPVILAYLVTGILIAYAGFIVANTEVFHLFSSLGIMFLLFLVGLEINYDSLKMVGKTAIFVGLGQIIFTSIIGFFIASILGIGNLPALYVAIALTFSSTIVVVKLLSDKRDIGSLYGKISVGFLLVQDIVAILILIFLSGIEADSGFTFFSLLPILLKGIVLFAIMIWLGRKIIPIVMNKVARSHELLFLVSLMWVFAVVAIVNRIGFSIEAAGFLAGLALANSSEHFQIAQKIRPLRDFFILLFFVVLGSSVVLSNLGGLTIPIIIFSLFVLIGNPIIVLALMGIMGYRKRTSFYAGVTVAQISEFSLILAALGLRLGHITEPILVLITAVGVVTIAISTYLIAYSEAIFKRLSRILSFFERRVVKEKITRQSGKKSIVLIGCHRTGENIAAAVPKRDLLIIDFDPEIINKLENKKFDYIFGDINDEEVFEKIKSSGARLIISTSPNFEDNFTLIENLKHSKKMFRLVLRAETEDEAKILYSKGADYVILPYFTSGQYIGRAIAGKDDILSILRKLKRHDLKVMN